MINREFGRMLRQARVAKGLQQHDVAQHVGVSQSTVSQWEQGRKTPHGVQVRRLVDLLAIPKGGYVNALVKLADPVEQAIVESTKLSPSEQDVMLTLYGHFTGRDSLGNVQILRFPDDEPPDAGDSES